MDPVYSRGECIAVIRDYYTFLTQMFMDDSCVIEPPQGGWPSITPESMQGTRKTEEVIHLLKDLPYIVNKPSSHAMPGCMSFDWAAVGAHLMSGKDPEGSLIMSEGFEDQFGGRIPNYYIGLMRGRRERDIVLLNTKDGSVHWMVCPDKIVETSLPKPSFCSWELPDGSLEDQDTQEGEQITAEVEDAVSEDGHNSDGFTEVGSDNDNSAIESDDPDDVEWGPYWSVRDFFEMLKNHCRCLNFIPRDDRHLIDIWNDSDEDGEPVPEGLPEMLQGIYRKHGWPDLNKYRKEECLAEVKRELDEKYPDNYKCWPY
jgi:hypothetical protein